MPADVFDLLARILLTRIAATSTTVPRDLGLARSRILAGLARYMALPICYKPPLGAYAHTTTTKSIRIPMAYPTSPIVVLQRLRLLALALPLRLLISRVRPSLVPNQNNADAKQPFHLAFLLAVPLVLLPVTTLHIVMRLRQNSLRSQQRTQFILRKMHFSHW